MDPLPAREGRGGHREEQSDQGDLTPALVTPAGGEEPGLQLVERGEVGLCPFDRHRQADASVEIAGLPAVRLPFPSGLRDLVAEPQSLAVGVDPPA